MRLAIVGAGEMGAAHAGAYARLAKKESVEIAGIVSRSPARARTLAKRAKAPWFTDPGQVLTDDSIDAVDVTVPSGVHRKVVVAALNHGKHVFCETPIALLLSDADAMIDAAHATQRTLMVAQVMRFVVDYRFAHDEAVSGKIGKPRVVVARRLSRPYWARKRRRPFALYGEPIIELGIHDFDVANWILGRPNSVTASGIIGPSGAIEHALAGIRYRGGTAFVEGSAMMPPGFPFTTSLRIQCDEGVLDNETQFVGGPRPRIRHVRYSAAGREFVRVRGADPYLEECRYFVRSVRRKADPKFLSPEAEREGLRIALAVRESVRTGRPVPLR